MLEAPARVDEFAGELVEQFQIHRSFALGPEVIEDFAQSGAEEMFPQTVHRHAGRQWVFFRDEPGGKIESIERMFRSMRSFLRLVLIC